MEKLEPTWYKGMYGCRQDMYGASAVLPLLARLEAAEAAVERVHVACAAHDSWNACVCDACVAVGANPAAVEYGAIV